MNVKTKIAAVVLAAGLVAVPVIAQRAHGPAGMHAFGAMPGFNPERMLEHVAVVLDLTDAQKQFAQKLIADTKAQAEPVVSQLRQGHEELAAAIKSNNTSGINTITTRQGTLMGQLAALHAKAMASFYAQLTPDQKAKADKLHEQMQERRSEFRERFQQRHNGPQGRTNPQGE